MAVYEIDGVKYELDDDIQGDELIETLTLISELPKDAFEGDQQAPSEQPYQSTYGEVGKDIDRTTLSGNSEWLRASREVYRMVEKKEWDGTDEDLSEWGLNEMAYTNYNLTYLGASQAPRVRKADQETKDAFLYMMDTFDNVNMSWAGAGNAAKAIVTDPMNLVGITTLAPGLMAKTAAKTAAVQGLKANLKQSLGRTGIIAGIEGGIYGAVDDTIKQGIEIDAGRKESLDKVQLLGAVGTGVGVGVVGGTVLDAVANNVVKGFRGLRSKQAPEASPTASASSDIVPHGERLEPSLGLEGPEPKAVPSSPSPTATGTRQLPNESPLSPSREVGAEGVVRANVDEVIDATPSGLFPARPLQNPMPFVPRSMTEITEFAQGLAKELEGMHYTQVEDVVSHLRDVRMTQAEWGDFQRSVQIAADSLRERLAATIRQVHQSTDPEVLERNVSEQLELEKLLAPLDAVDSALPSMTGSILRQMQEGMAHMRNITPDKIMAAQGVTRREAEEIYTGMLDRSSQIPQVSRSLRKFDDDIDRAMASGDITEASRLTAAKHDYLHEVSNTDPGVLRKLNELAISNVFSPTTLQINIIPSLAKTLLRPLSDALFSDPLQAATRRQLVATYAAMKSSLGAAWRAALASFQYEQSLLTHDAGRLLEGGMALSGKFAGSVRLFPRLLNASDEFMSQIAYRGFLAGDAAAKGYEAGAREGLKGKALDDFVKERVRERLTQAFTNDASATIPNIVKNKGVNMGLKGKELSDYIERELSKSPAIQHGTDAEGVDYVRDVLYKREFSGESPWSRSAARLEQIINDMPIIRFAGQLFYRTPIRVFEEGIRVTPGVQFVAPGFIADLTGKNGKRAQLRAQGEALMSFAMGSMALSLYAQGRITGDGAYSDWKQQRNRRDSDLPEPYTITLEDGSTWSFRNFDPIATPLKILVNAFERFDHLEMRKAQGERVPEATYERIKGAVYVGLAATTQAVRDANLMGGIDTFAKLAEDLGDPERNEAAYLRFMGEKLRTLVPNTLHKIARTNDPTLDDPKTFFQGVESSLLGGITLGWYVKTGPKSYDYLGNVREINDTGALWGVFSTASPVDRMKDRSEKEMAVLRKLDHISKQTGATFTAPYKTAMTGNIDLREEMTNDGKETLYDRWNRYYKELGPENVLYPILNAGLPVGTVDVRASTVTVARTVVDDLRKAALGRLIAEESGARDLFIKNVYRQAGAKAGFWDQ